MQNTNRAGYLFGCVFMRISSILASSSLVVLTFAIFSLRYVLCQNSFGKKYMQVVVRCQTSLSGMVDFCKEIEMADSQKKSDATHTLSYEVLNRQNFPESDRHCEIEVCASPEGVATIRAGWVFGARGLVHGRGFERVARRARSIGSAGIGRVSRQRKAIVGAHSPASDGQRPGVFGLAEISTRVVCGAGHDGAVGQASGPERADQLPGHNASSDALAPAFARDFQALAAVVFPTPLLGCPHLSR